MCHPDITFIHRKSTALTFLSVGLRRGGGSSRHRINFSSSVLLRQVGMGVVVT